MAILSGSEVYVTADGGVPFTSPIQVPNAVGSGDAVNKGQFPATLAANGTQTLPSGLIIKWGTGTASSAGVIITYPVAFPTATVLTVINPRYQGAQWYGMSEIIGASSFTSYSSTAGPNNCTWFAIGY